MRTAGREVACRETVAFAGAVLAATLALLAVMATLASLGFGTSQAAAGIGSTTSAEAGLPSNEFSFGKLKRNERRGTAKLTVVVPGPGQLELAKTKKVKADEEYAEFPEGEIPDLYGENLAGKETLVVKPAGKAKKTLERTGTTRVKAKVTYTPDDGEANTKVKRVRLLKQR